VHHVDVYCTDSAFSRTFLYSVSYLTVLSHCHSLSNATNLYKGITKC